MIDQRIGARWRRMVVNRAGTRLDREDQQRMQICTPGAVECHVGIYQ